MFCGGERLVWAVALMLGMCGGCGAQRCIDEGRRELLLRAMADLDAELALWSDGSAPAAPPPPSDSNGMLCDLRRIVNDNDNNAGLDLLDPLLVNLDDARRCAVGHLEPTGLPPLVAPAPEPVTPDTPEEIPYLCADEERITRFHRAVEQANADVELWGTTDGVARENRDELCMATALAEVDCSQLLGECPFANLSMGDSRTCITGHLEGVPALELPDANDLDVSREDTDCDGTWAACTSECEQASNRTWIETVAQRGRGAACPQPSACLPGQGECPLDVDCTGSFEPCTAECEGADDRTWNETAAQSGRGAACPEASPCQPGQGECPLDVDCTGSFEPCTAACEGVDDRTWNEMAAQSGRGAACPEASPCQPGQGECPLDVDCTGSFEPCTAACEVASERVWIETVVQSGRGAVCPTASSCQPGDGDCPENADCAGSFELCTANCEVASERVWIESTAQSGRGRLCPQASSCQPGEGECPPNVDCEGSFSPCTQSCEPAALRTWSETVAHSGQGEPCPQPSSCRAGEGGCTATLHTDCAGSWSSCTALCERAEDRVWTEAATQSGNGAACPDARPCQPGEGECAENIDCAGSFEICTTACEVADDRVWRQVVAQSGRGASCPVGSSCQPGEGSCPENIDCAGSFASCTAECEVGRDRVWTESVARSGQGASCPVGSSCQPGEGSCPEDIDCAGSFAPCTAECETYNERTWIETQTQSGRGATCAQVQRALSCMPGDGECPEDVDCTGRFVACSGACEAATRRIWIESVSRSGRGAACPSAMACRSGDGECVTVVSSVPASSPDSGDPTIEPPGLGSQTNPEPDAAKDTSRTDVAANLEGSDGGRSPADTNEGGLLAGWTQVEVALTFVLITLIVVWLVQSGCGSRHKIAVHGAQAGAQVVPHATPVDPTAGVGSIESMNEQTHNPLATAAPGVRPYDLTAFQEEQPEPEPEELQGQPTPSWANEESLGFLPKMAVQFSNVIVGRGSHGVVYKGWLQMATGVQDVAIKMLAPGATEREARQFVKEFQIALKASQRCRGAAMMYGCVLNDDNALCLVMKLYKCALNDYLDARRDPLDDAKRQGLDPAHVADFACQIASILATLHASKIVVQDLKPSNVLLDANENLFIADYGLAVIVERSITSTMSMVGGVGTQQYMAPEQHDPATFGKVSEKTDVWALGCIILEMLTGHTAWAGKRHTEILMNVAMKRLAPTIPSGLPEALDTTLRRCLVHNQEERASTQEVIERLQPLASGAVAL